MMTPFHFVSYVFLIVWCFIQGFIAIMLLLIELKKGKSLYRVKSQIFIMTAVLYLSKQITLKSKC